MSTRNPPSTPITQRPVEDDPDCRDLAQWMALLGIAVDDHESSVGEHIHVGYVADTVEEVLCDLLFIDARFIVTPLTVIQAVAETPSQRLKSRQPRRAERPSPLRGRKLASAV